MPPGVSIVVPTYKSAQWIEQTLQSIVEQTYPRDLLELIVVDDKSPDDTVAIASAFLKHHDLSSRIIERETNGGVTASRNIGWKSGSGEWVQFLDHDDLLLPHKIQLQAEQAAKLPEDVAVIYSGWQHLELINGQWQRSGPIVQPRSDDYSLINILQDTKFGYVGQSLIRRSFLEKVGGFVERPNISEDLDLMLRIRMAGGQFRAAYSESPGLLYRQSPNSLWRHYIKNPVAMQNRLSTFRAVHEFLRSQSPSGVLSSEARDALALRYTADADFYLQHDAESFQLIVGWMRELGLRSAPNLNGRMQLLARLIGYEQALRLRKLYREFRVRSKE
jgi:glycosyltransferase involved in cell wall biosynthesis